MLQQKVELKPAFINSVSGFPKKIECVRVDSASDEGPSHLEVQLWWACKKLPTHVTMLTARNSGDSYLNRVELQNGCLALGHANLFIPSNLTASCYDPTTSKMDIKRNSKKIMSLATQIYINHVSDSPCGT